MLSHILSNLLPFVSPLPRMHFFTLTILQCQRFNRLFGAFVLCPYVSPSTIFVQAGTCSGIILKPINFQTLSYHIYCFYCRRICNMELSFCSVFPTWLLFLHSYYRPLYTVVLFPPKRQLRKHRLQYIRILRM